MTLTLLALVLASPGPQHVSFPIGYEASFGVATHSSGGQAEVVYERKYDTATLAGLTAGIRYHFNEQLSLGASYGRGFLLDEPLVSSERRTYAELGVGFPLGDFDLRMLFSLGTLNYRARKDTILWVRHGVDPQDIPSETFGEVWTGFGLELTHFTSRHVGYFARAVGRLSPTFSDTVLPLGFEPSGSFSAGMQFGY